MILKYDVAPSLEGVGEIEADAIVMSVGSVEDVDAALGLFDEAVAWLVARGVTGQWGTTPFSLLPSMRARMITWASEERLFLAHVEGRLAGTVVLSESIPAYALSVLPGFTEPAYYLEAFTTSRSMSGQGIGRALLLWAEEYAMSQGKRGIWLDCWADNPALVAYYSGAGFVPQGDFYAGSWHGMLFHRALE